MRVAAFDTLQAAKRLKEAGFSNDQAEAVANVLRESQVAGVADLATKADLLVLKTDLMAAMSDLKADIFKWIVPLLLGQSALTAALVKLL